MPAQSKDALLAVMEKEFTKLFALCQTIDAAVALCKRDEDTSIKDVIAHRAHWIDLFLGWYADGQAEKEVQFPAPGYKWSELKRYNADLRETQSQLGWDNAKEMLESRYRKLRNLIDGLSDDALYGQPMKGAKNDWTTGRWAEAAGPSHFRSAAKYIRACLKADRQ